MDNFRKIQVWTRPRTGQKSLIFRESRTMLISTHYMDEAEALADQIVIISKGSLKCSGSTSFLKNNLGDGYHLALRKESI